MGSAYEESGAASSPVWFTVAQGILTEVFYPTADTAQTGDFQFLVTDGDHFFSEQKRDTSPLVTYTGEGMAVKITGRDRQGKYSYTETIVTDPSAPVVRVHLEFHWNQPHLRLFALLKPTIGNAGNDSVGNASSSGLSATSSGANPRQPAVATFLAASVPYLSTGVGYFGFSDGWQDISRNFKMTQTAPSAGPGDVALTGELGVSGGESDTVDLALAFGASRSEAQAYATTGLSVPFAAVQSNYESGWRRYLSRLSASSLLTGKRFFAESTFARRSAQLIKMHEDKRNRGAIVASLSNPAIPDAENAPDLAGGTGGYHLVWPRDLYHAALGLLAAGDVDTAKAVLAYLVSTQKSDGSWAQNFWINGTPYFPSLQMDEVAFPVLLAAQLQARAGLALTGSTLEMVRRASEFIIAHGPQTPEDRWEENGGYVPSTIAAEIAALRIAAKMLGDTGLSGGADRWQSQIERWTFVNSGSLGKNYYLRASPTGNPGLSEPFTVANNGGHFTASDILDGGFLDLVRLGVREASDPRIVSSLEIYDSAAKGLAQADSASPSANLYRRYHHDAYGPGHVGGLWPLLAGERGHYALAAGDGNTATSELFVMEKAALETGLIPEQVESDVTNSNSGRYSSGAGVACPLVWAHAEDILLHRSIEEGHAFDSPARGP